jgi:hypothetical protein
VAEVLAVSQPLKGSKAKVPIDPLGGQQFLLYWANHAGQCTSGDDPLPGTMGLWSIEWSFAAMTAYTAPEDQESIGHCLAWLRLLTAFPLIMNSILDRSPCQNMRVSKPSPCDTNDSYEGHKVYLKFLGDGCRECEIPKEFVIAVADSLLDDGPQVLEYAGIWWDAEQYRADWEEEERLEWEC